MSSFLFGIRIQELSFIRTQFMCKLQVHYVTPASTLNYKYRFFSYFSTNLFQTWQVYRYWIVELSCEITLRFVGKWKRNHGSNNPKVEIYNHHISICLWPRDLKMYSSNLLVNVYLAAKFQEDSIRIDREIAERTFSYFASFWPWPLTYAPENIM